MIATFPDFSKLDLTHKTELENITRQFEPYSDFNFTSLHSWNTDSSTEIAKLNGNVVIKLPDYISGDTIYTLLGNNDIDNTLRQLLTVTSELNMVPEAVIKSIESPASFNISEAPEHFDYIFSLEHLALLPGQKYRGKRKSIYRFMRIFKDSYLINVLDLSSPITQSNIKITFEKWGHERGKINQDYLNEQLAIHRLLKNASSIDLIAMEIIIDKQMVGFSINEAHDNSFIICHFQKSILTHKGIDVFLTSEVAKELLARGYTYINWEQDLGLDGLKQMKSSYKPVKMLKKYTISRVPD